MALGFFLAITSFMFTSTLFEIHTLNLAPQKPIRLQRDAMQVSTVSPRAAHAILKRKDAEILRKFPYQNMDAHSFAEATVKRFYRENPGRNKTQETSRIERRYKEKPLREPRQFFRDKYANFAHWSRKQDRDQTAYLANTKSDRIVIAAHMRSGSSFLGQILAQDPDTFYAFEPLWLLDPDRRETNRICAEYKLLSLSDLLFECDVSLLSFCLNENNLQLNAGHNKITAPTVYTQKLCEWKKHRVAKIIRYHDLERLTNEIARNGGVIFYLVRDPRGILMSRKRAYEKMTRDFHLKNETEELCSDYDRSLQFLEKHFETTNYTSQNSNVVLVRYEDFAQSPVDMTETLYAFLGRPMHRFVWHFLMRSTTSSRNKEDMFGTIRDSEKTSEAWRRVIQWDELTLIQGTCTSVLQRLGYKIVSDSLDLIDQHTSLVSTVEASVPVLPSHA